MCFTHLRRVSADDATTFGWVSSILLLSPIFSLLLTISRESSSSGLSPRGRGNHADHIPGGVGERSIPAWAGEPGWTMLPRSITRVYPRVGGEPPAQVGRKLGNAVYPRVGGGTWVRSHTGRESWGLSPRGRGNPGRGLIAHTHQGSIPAWAGEPLVVLSCE